MRERPSVQRESGSQAQEVIFSSAHFSRMQMRSLSTSLGVHFHLKGLFTTVEPAVGGPLRCVFGLRHRRWLVHKLLNQIHHGADQRYQLEPVHAMDLLTFSAYDRISRISASRPGRLMSSPRFRASSAVTAAL